MSRGYEAAAGVVALPGKQDNPPTPDGAAECQPHEIGQLAPGVLHELHEADAALIGRESVCGEHRLAIHGGNADRRPWQIGETPGRG